MNQEQIDAFLFSGFARVCISKVNRTGNDAWVVLSTGPKKYLGTISQSSDAYWVFTRRHPEGTRVSDLETAIMLIGLTETSEWVEDGTRRYVRGGLRLPLEGS